MSATSVCESDIKQRITFSLQNDEYFRLIKEKLEQELGGSKNKGDQLSKDGLLVFNNRLYIPNSTELRKLIMNEFHKRPYVSQLGCQKMTKPIWKVYFWPGMKKDIVEYISKFLECQQVKVEHMHPTRLLQLIQIPEWKWEVISIDFIT